MSEVDAFLAELALDPAPPLEELGPGPARELFDAVLPDWDLPPGPVPFEEVAMDVAADGPPLLARIYTPKVIHGPEVVVHLHGGGWVVGGWRTHGSMCASIAAALGRRLVLPAYARAPEAARSRTLADVDAAAGLAERLAHAAGAGLRCVVLSGDSAGGNLALLETIRRPARVAMLALLYPALDMTAADGSFDEFAEGHLLTARDMRWYERAYAAGDDAALPELSPGIASLPDGMPPVCLATAGLDVLRDQGRQFASRLALRGNRVHYAEMTAMIHGFGLLRRQLPTASLAFDQFTEAASALLSASCGDARTRVSQS